MTVVGIALEQAHHRPGEADGQLAHQLAQRNDRPGGAFVPHPQRSTPAALPGQLQRLGERVHARERLVQHHAQGVEVAARIGVPLQLLGRQVAERAQHLAHVPLLVFRHLGDPEVRHPHPRSAAGQLAVQQDVVGLDVPVDDALGVDVVQRRQDLQRHLPDLPPVPARSRHQGAVGRVLHGVEPLPLAGIELEHPQAVGVVQPGRGAKLTLEPDQVLGRRPPGVQHLQGQHPVAPPIAGPVHGAHAPTPQLLAQLERSQYPAMTFGGDHLRCPGEQGPVTTIAPATRGWHSPPNPAP